MIKQQRQKAKTVNQIKRLCHISTGTVQHNFGFQSELYQMLQTTNKTDIGIAIVDSILDLDFFFILEKMRIMLSR